MEGFPEKSDVTLVDLPVELVQKQILPELELNDVLRLRRVCKQLKIFTDDYVWNNADKLGEVEITESAGKDLATLLDKGIIPSKLFLNNERGHGFFESMSDQVLLDFQNTVAIHVKCLRVVEVSLYPSSKEWTFYSSLTNLESFEALYYGHGQNPEFNIHQAREDLRLDLEGPMLPGEWIEGLQKIMIGHNPNYPINFDISRRYELILEKFVNITEVSLPYLSFDPNSDSGFKPTNQRNLSQEKFNRQFSILRQLVRKGKLKTIDFANLNVESSRGIDLLGRLAHDNIFQLMSACLAKGTKIKNFNSNWLTFHDDLHDHYNERNGEVVLSLINLHERVNNFDLDNGLPMDYLEEVNITDTGKSSVDTMFVAIRPDWPALRRVKIHVNSRRNDELQQDTSVLFDFWWRDAEWFQVADLKISFERNYLPVPNTRDIISSMPNLTKVTLVNWIGSNAAVMRLWNGLPRLTDVTIDACKAITNDAFFGESRESPLFLKLEGLQHFALLNLSCMPGITDDLFSNVIAKMSLTHFYVSSTEPIVQVTRRGLTHLINGRFNETIERFPFHGWALSDMTDGQLQMEAKKFRSTLMI